MKIWLFSIVAAILATGASFVFFNSDSFDPASVRNRRVLVTGASTGIGEQLAYKYAELGARLVLTARRVKALREVADRCRRLGSPNVEVVPGDMGYEEDRERVARETVQRLGGLDYLVLNHVTATTGFWLGTSENVTALRRALSVNFFAYVDLASRLLPALTKSGGSIGVVSSVAGTVGFPILAPYSATKFAIQGFFSSLRQELLHRRTNVAITVVVLGFVDTDSAVTFARDHSSKMDVSTAVPANVTARVIVEGVASRRPTVYYPLSAFVAVKIQQFLPAFMDYFLQNHFL